MLTIILSNYEQCPVPLKMGGQIRNPFTPRVLIGNWTMGKLITISKTRARTRLGFLALNLLTQGVFVLQTPEPAVNDQCYYGCFLRCTQFSNEANPSRVSRYKLKRSKEKCKLHEEKKSKEQEEKNQGLNEGVPLAGRLMG